MQRKRIRKIIIGVGFLVCIILCIIFVLRYKEYKKYVHFKDENLQEIMQASSDWSQYFDLRDGKVSVKQAKQITEIYIKGLYARWENIPSYEDLLNFPNTEYIELGVAPAYESGDSSAREMYLKQWPIVEEPLYVEKLKPALAELEKLRWVRIYSDVVLEDLEIFSQCNQIQDLDVCQNQLKNLNGIENLKIRFADFSENEITDITAAAETRGIRFLVLTDNEIEDFSPLLEVSGLEAVAFDTDMGNGKEIADKLTEKGCGVTDDKWGPYEAYWDMLDAAEE